MKINKYAVALRFRAAIVAVESSSVYEILMCLAREIIIKCSNAILKDYIQLISQLVKKINKKKSQKIFKKILIAKKLSNRNIIITINIKKIKK